MHPTHTLWLLITVSFTVGLVLTLSTLATWVALFVEDSARRADAYKVLKLLLRAGGGSGLVATVVQLAVYWLV